MGPPFVRHRRTIDNTEVDPQSPLEMSALEALCVSPKGDQRLQLARQLTAAALNCVISGAGANCGGLLEIKATFTNCNNLCAGPPGTDLGMCIEELDAFNNGITPFPNCAGQSLVNVGLGLNFEPPGPAGSSQACKAATKNGTTIFGPPPPP